MKVNTLTVSSPLLLGKLDNISSKPKYIYYIGDLTSTLTQPCLAIVGSRKVSHYGETVTFNLARQAAEQGITIISGLALGVDSIAHKGALDAKGRTLAVLPCGLDRIYPASHRNLAERILQQGGALISEYPFNTQPFKANFLARNRIISALSDAVLITEAADRSGSLNTASHALEQGKSVMAVPGPITSELSRGTNNLIKVGATPVTEATDILSVLGMQLETVHTELFGDTREETTLLQLLARGISDTSELLHHSNLDPAPFNQALSMLEINGRVRALGAGHWGIK